MVGGRTYVLPDRSSESDLPDASKAFTREARYASPGRDIALVSLTDDAHDLCAA